MKVVFLHPDFGIGGAERLVLDSALAMKKKGHVVRIVTNQFSPDHCFTELMEFENDLTVHAPLVPRTIFGKLYAFCAYLRLCIAALYICIFERDADVIFCDQISAPLPILRLCTNASLLFYCHYPDQLLTNRDSFWKKLYRLLIDQIEAWSMGWAHEILVNSRFTERVVRDTFPTLADRNLTVLYPSINCEFIDNIFNRMKHHLDEISEELGHDLLVQLEDDDTHVFLSINRFERKKNISLAIHAFDHLTRKISENCILVIAGGYDVQNTENIKHFDELVALTMELNLQNSVKFIKSPSDLAKIWLFDIARLILYTPDREHFGIVPVEAMWLSKPVLAVNSGGPTESIVNEETGFLRVGDPEVFAKCMELVIDDPAFINKMGIAGHKHVEQNFSFDTFANLLNDIINSLHRNSAKQ